MAIHLDQVLNVDSRLQVGWFFLDAHGWKSRAGQEDEEQLSHWSFYRVVTLFYSSLTSSVSLPSQRNFVGGSVFLSEPVGLGEEEIPGPRDPILT